MEPHVREVTKFLRETYGATNVHIETGGKHNRLCFLYKGRERKYVMSHRNPGDWHVMMNIKRDIKNMLGKPDLFAAKHKPARTLEDMIHEVVPITDTAIFAATTVVATAPEVHFMQSTTPVQQAQILQPEPVARTLIVSVASYKVSHLPDDQRQTYFYFPSAIADTFANKFSVVKLDDEHWKFVPHGRHTFRHHKGGLVKVVFTGPGTESWGASKGEAVEADGELLIYLAKDNRAMLRDNRAIPTKQQLTLSLPEKAVVPLPVAVPTKTPALQTPDPVRTSGPTKPGGEGAVEHRTMEERMRDIVYQVREIEALCPYRLVRLESGRIVWRAPTIE